MFEKLQEAVKDTTANLVARYEAPTPRKWKRWGNLIFGLGTVATALAACVAAPWVAVVAAGLTWVGKTITDFAKE
jgi:hypothetical protein